ncbi:hypothetical protein BTR23_17305 [Alkalihalophilus pseudofirmus]|nr:hypothetical protein BTR23_17305 [Alkalihalophilus pseudofirmus]
MTDNLDCLFAPSSIAVIGATNNYYKNGGRVLINLQKSKFSGELYAVNPKYTTVLGVQCYPSILEIPSHIDIVCVIVPAENITEVIKECIMKDVKVAVIFSSEHIVENDSNINLQMELNEMIKGTNLRIYGPNVAGMFDFRNKWGLSFSPKFEPQDFVDGSIGLITQGGSLGRAVLDSNQKGIGFSYWVATGNEIDLNTTDFLTRFVEDENIEIILMILERPLPSKLLECVNESYLKQKPIIVLKLGQYPISMHAINHHFNSNQSMNQGSQLVLKHPGVIKVDDLDELVGLSWLFQKFKGSYENRVLIYSWIGGSGILLTDMCEKYGVELPQMSDELVERLSSLFTQGQIMNPLDLTTILYEDVSIFRKSLEVIVASKEYDTILVPIPFWVDQLSEDIVYSLIEITKESGIPIIPIFLSTGEMIGSTYEYITQSGYPYFTKVETAVKVLSLFLDYKRLATINIRGVML